MTEYQIACKLGDVALNIPFSGSLSHIIEGFWITPTLCFTTDFEKAYIFIPPAAILFVKKNCDPMELVTTEELQKAGSFIETTLQATKWPE